MTAVGSPLYAAPELIKGEAYGEKVDVYTFGLAVLLDPAVAQDILAAAAHGQGPGAAIFHALRPHYMVEDGWHPITDAAPIPFAPLSVNRLIERC